MAHLSNNPDRLAGLALKATIRTFLTETFHSARTAEDDRLFETVRHFVDTVFRGDLAKFLWFAPWLRPLCRWYARWHVITQLRALHLDPLATLEALNQEIHAYAVPDDRDSGTIPVVPELLELLRCPADQQPLEMHTDAQGKVWLINPRNGYCYAVHEGIPILIKEEGQRRQNAAFIQSR